MPVSAVPVDDSRAVEVVWRELAANAIAREDADPEASHLARDVSEDDVVVVELYAEHRVRKGLDHLTLEFNLVLLCHVASHLVAGAVATATCFVSYIEIKLPAPAPRSGLGRFAASVSRGPLLRSG